MSHFAHIDENDRVTQVIVAEQDFINSGAVGDPSRWIQTSYNTYGNQHKLGGTPLRGNYAGIGYYYISLFDVFVPPKPHNSWKLNQDTFLWDPPTPMPNDGKTYSWNEDTLSWDEVVITE